MNHETSSEDRTILAALEALERGSPLPTLPPGQRDEIAETLARLYTEVLGLIPSELEPVAPRPEVKQRLMALIAGEETQDVRGEAAPVPQAAPSAEPEPPAHVLVMPDLPDELPAAPEPPAGFPAMPEPRSEAAGTPVAPPVLAEAPEIRERPEIRETPRPGGGALSRQAGEGWGGGVGINPGSAVASVVEPPPRPSTAWPAGAAAARPAKRWPLSLAAVLSLALLGFSFWLGASNVRQRQTIAALQSQLERQEQEAEQRLRQVQSQLHEMRGNLSLVAQYAVEASPLQPVGEAPMFPGARGVLFVAPDHQHWYMSVQGLGPAGEEQVYQLWFVADTGTVSGGTFTARPGEQAELSSAQMPSGTRGVVVTLEPGQGSAAPTGPEVLRATNVYPIV